MSAFAVAAFYEPRLPAGTARVQAVVWIRATGLGSPGPGVALRVWTPAGAQVAALREIAPGSGDVLASLVPADERTLVLDAGAWEDGVREYELEVALPARAAGDEMLAARVAVVAGGEVAGGALIPVTWTASAPPGPAGARPSGGAGASSPTAVAPADLPTAVAPADLPTGASPADLPTGAPPTDLPTGASPEPRHMRAEDTPGGPCPGCGELPDDGDRFCEACGSDLVAPA